MTETKTLFAIIGADRFNYHRHGIYGIKMIVTRMGIILIEINNFNIMHHDSGVYDELSWIFCCRDHTSDIWDIICSLWSKSDDNQLFFLWHFGYWHRPSAFVLRSIRV